MKQIFTFLIIFILLCPLASSQELGANFNHNPEIIEINDLKRAGVQTVRSTPRLYEYLDGERDVETDVGLERLIDSKSAGYKVIFGFRMDFNKNNERLPAPESARETEIFDIIKGALERLGPNGVDVFTLGNEFNLETEPDDLAFNENNEIPLVVFLQRMMDNVIEPLYAQEGWDRPSVYLGSFPQLFQNRWQTNDGIIELLRLTENDARIEGLAIHFHLDDFGQADNIFNFVRQYIPEKPFIVTEFSMHRLNNSNKNEQIGINQAGIDWANRYGYDPNDLVRDYYAHVNTNQVEPQEFKGFFDTRTWFIQDYLDQFREKFSNNNVLYATYPILQQSAPTSFEDGEPVWFLNPLLMQVSLVRNELELLSENPLCAEQFYNWSPLESEIILDTDITGPVLINESKILLHLPFEDNINDQSGNSHMVTLDVEGTNSFESGKFGNALSFNQTALTAGEVDWWNSNQSFSISVWVKADQLPSEVGRAFAIIHQKDGGTNPGRVHAEILRAGNNPGSFTDGERGDAVGFTVPVDEWFHFGLVVDREAKERKLYINGSLNSIHSTGSVESSNQPVSIGANKGQAGSWFSGSLDDLLITSEVLSDLQMSSLANGSVQDSNLSSITTYNSSTWSDGEPDAAKNASMETNYTVVDGQTLEVKSLLINDGAVLTVESGGTLIINAALSNEGSLIVRDGASLLTFDGFAVGTVTVEKNIGTGDNLSLISSPVLSGSIGSGFGTSFEKYDESIGFDIDQGASRWVNASNDLLLPGNGYAQRGKQMLSFSGKPNAGRVIEEGLTKTSFGTSDLDNQGWHLIGNPYVSKIAVDEFLSDNALSAVYLYHPESDQYLTANPIGQIGQRSNSFDGTIDIAEGFFIQVPEDDYSIAFEEDQRLTKRSSSVGIDTYLSLSLAGEYEREILIGFTDEATSGIDQTLDATVFPNQGVLTFYSLSDANKLAIQALPELSEAEQRITIGYESTVSGNYSLEATTNGLDGYNVFILDGEDITDITSTTMNLMLSEGKTELVLLLSKEAINEELLGVSNNLSTLLYPNPTLNSIAIRSENQFREAKLYSLNGRLILSMKTLVKSMNLSNILKGTYILELIHESGAKETHRVIKM